jgi:hypothetical protein
MTLPRLLSKMARRTPRFVTVEGVIISADDGVIATPNGHRHPEYGPVTAVRRHTNHGGVPPPETEARPWWERDPALLEREKQAMDRAFPGFAFTEMGGRPAWQGEINSGRGRFGIIIVHRPDHGLPHVIPVNPSLFRRQEGRRVRKSLHLYADGRLCVADQSDWASGRDDASTVIGWAAHWLAAFTEWRITGRWPREGAEVDVL